MHGVERACPREKTFGTIEGSIIEVTSVEAMDDCELVERTETLVNVRFMVIGSVVFRVVELLEIVGHSVQSGGLFDVVLREKLRGHSAKLANLAEAVLAADAHTCGGVREVGDHRWRRAWAGRRGAEREGRLGDIHCVVPYFRSQCHTFEIRRRLMLGAGGLEVGAAEIDEPHLVSQCAGFASTTAKDRALVLACLGVVEIGASACVAVRAKPERLCFGLPVGVGRVDGRTGAEVCLGKADPAGRAFEGPPRWR